MILVRLSHNIPGADPGFPVGGHIPVLRCGGGGGGEQADVDLQCRHFLVKMYAKPNELGPGRGACAGKFCM